MRDLEIEIQLNGEKKKVPEGISIAALIVNLDLDVTRVAVEHNLQILKREKWQVTKLADRDRIEIVQFVGGGLS